MAFPQITNYSDLRRNQNQYTVPVAVTVDSLVGHLANYRPLQPWYAADTVKTYITKIILGDTITSLIERSYAALLRDVAIVGYISISAFLNAGLPVTDHGGLVPDWEDPTKFWGCLPDGRFHKFDGRLLIQPNTRVARRSLSNFSLYRMVLVYKRLFTIMDGSSDRIPCWMSDHPNSRSADLAFSGLVRMPFSEAIKDLAVRILWNDETDDGESAHLLYTALEMQAFMAHCMYFNRFPILYNHMLDDTNAVATMSLQITHNNFRSSESNRRHYIMNYPFTGDVNNAIVSDNVFPTSLIYYIMLVQSFCLDPTFALPQFRRYDDPENPNGNYLKKSITFYFQEAAYYTAINMVLGTQPSLLSMHYWEDQVPGAPFVDLATCVANTPIAKIIGLRVTEQAQQIAAYDYAFKKFSDTQEREFATSFLQKAIKYWETFAPNQDNDEDLNQYADPGFIETMVRGYIRARRDNPRAAADYNNKVVYLGAAGTVVLLDAV
jgi:hypothetical protein